MNEFLKMDVFFLVATGGVAVIAVLVALALYRILRILRNVEKISEIVKEQGQLVRGDIADLRASVRQEGFKFRSIARFFASIFGRGRNRAEK